MRKTLAVLLFFGLWFLQASPAGADSPCDDPDNLTFNCDFDNFVPTPAGLVPEGWWPFVLMGHPAFDNMCDSPRCPALRIWSDGEHFTAGIYQQVPNVQPGVAYLARLGWAVFASPSDGPNIERKVGIDPYGGTDPTSPNIVWSPSVWEKKRVSPELQVSAVAQNTVITVFVWVHNPITHGADQVFLDAVSLVVDPNQPPPTPTPSPTPTALPTFTATPMPSPTFTPTFTPTPSPTATSTPTVTFTPTPTSSPTATFTPSPSPTPTVTPSPTPRPFWGSRDALAQYSLYVSLSSFAGAGILAVALLWLWKSRQGS